MRMIAAFAFCLLTSSSGVDPHPTTHLDGLSADLQGYPNWVALGDVVHLVVVLAFDTTTAASDTRILNQFSSRCEFIFVNKKTGQSFARSPYDGGLPRMVQPGNLVHMKHGDRLRTENWTVHLLSEKGEQIPAGEYSVIAMYENDGGGKTEAYLDSTHQYHTRVYDGPWALWTGKIQSAPWIVTIVPASEQEIEVAVPKTLVVDDSRIPGQIGWSYKATSKIRVHKRPGFALGNRWHLETRVDGTMVSEYPRGEGGLDSSGMSFLPPDVSARVQAAKEAELILHMEVFETSVQPGHMWMPEQGDFKVLWRGQTRYKFPAKGK